MTDPPFIAAGSSAGDTRPAPPPLPAQARAARPHSRTGAPGAPAAPAPPAPDETPHPLSLSWTALRRGRRPVLAPAQATLPAGAVVGLVGANGAGKSTLLMALAGTLARRCGQATAARGGLAAAAVGYVPQRPALAPWLSVRGAVALLGVDVGATLASMPQAAALADLADLADRRADALSGGQAQILAVAAVLARGDPLVLLDEPFAGVDLRHRAALVTCVGDHRRRHPGSVIILASHLAADLDALCDWLLVLDHGALVFAGARNALPAAPWECDDPDGDPGLADGAADGAGNGAALLERRLAALLR